MKKLFLLVISFAFFSCEDVVDVDLEAEVPRLIVDALIRINTDNPTIVAEVRVLESASFFGEIQPAQLNQITISNLDKGEGIVLNEIEPGTGIYQSLETGIDFFTEGELVLQINYKEESFIAFTEYVPSVPIDNLTQGSNTLFDENDTEVIVSFTDDPDRTDFYLFDFDFNQFLVTEDTFYQGQQFDFSFFYDEDLQPGQEVTISILGVDLSFFNYMDKLIEQSDDAPGVFDVPVATVRGNLFNVTDLDNVDVTDNLDTPDNFALGYFAVAQVFSRTITIE